MPPAAYAVLLVPGFALHALRRAEPGLMGRPVGLIEGEGRRAVLTHASAEAVGVEPGLAPALAMARCPGILLKARDVAAETQSQRLLVAAAFTLSPRVEATGAGFCTVDLAGADPVRTEALLRLRVAELTLTGLPALAGTGPTPLLALYAARQASPVLLLGEPRPFLAPLPLGFAEPLSEHAAILAAWGVRTLGDLTDLPKDEIGRRLGAAGVALWERAAGEATRLLRLAEPDRSFAAQWPYEPPVESIEPLFFKLRRFAETIALELTGAGFVAEKLSLTLFLEDGGEHRREFRLPEPAAEVDAWMRVLGSHLSTVRTPARVSGVRLVASPARPPLKQDGLFETALRDPASFWENLARLEAIVGEGRVGTPVPADTNRPDAFAMVRPWESVPPPGQPGPHPALGPVLRRFRPPWPAQVACEAGVPARIAGPLGGTVCRALGPWRSSGDWWKPGGWDAETWQVELDRGGVYQIAREAGGWRVEGVLD